MSGLVLTSLVGLRWYFCPGKKGEGARETGEKHTTDALAVSRASARTLLEAFWQGNPALRHIAVSISSDLDHPPPLYDANRSIHARTRTACGLKCSLGWKSGQHEDVAVTVTASNRHAVREEDVQIFSPLLASCWERVLEDGGNGCPPGRLLCSSYSFAGTQKTSDSRLSPSRCGWISACLPSAPCFFLRCHPDRDFFLSPAVCFVAGRVPNVSHFATVFLSLPTRVAVPFLQEPQEAGARLGGPRADREAQEASRWAW